MTRPPDAQAMEKIAKDERIWITRDLDSGRFHLNEELASRWPNPEPPDEDEAPQGWRCNGRLRCGVGDEDGPSSPPVRLCDDATRLLATFVYFDSFEDILPRNVLFSELRPAKKATVGDRCHSFVWALDKHKIPRLRRRFILRISGSARDDRCGDAEKLASFARLGRG